MARSVGEALSTGLESGLRLAMDYNAQRTQQARQAELDRQHLEDRAFNRTRIERGDARQQGLDTLSMGEAELNDIAQQVPAASTPEARAGLVRREGAVRGAMSQARGTIGGPAFAPSAAAKPDVRAILARYQRGPNGEPSEPEAAAMQVMQSIEGGDANGAVAGLNVLHRDSINRIVGKPSPHGGTIVGARIEALDPSPNSPAGDLEFIPRMKIWVKGDGKGAGSGDEARALRADPNAPPGATGYYFAPITEDRGTGPTSKVRRFGMRDQLDLIGQHLHLAELVNSEEGRAKLAEGGMTPQEWADLEQRMAPRRPKRTTKDVQLRRGDSVLREQFDTAGNPIPGTRERIEGNARTDRNSAADIEFRLGEIDALEQEDKDANTLTPGKRARFEADRRAILTGIKPGKYTGEAGAGGGAGGPSLKEREAARKERKDDLTSLDKDVDAADKRVDNARASLSAHLREKPDAFATPEASAAWTADRERLKAKQDKAEAAHQEAIDAKKAGQAEYQRAKAAEEAARSPTMGDAKSGKAAAPAAKPPAVGTVKGGYRFKGGNPASQASWEKV